jgi:hypothetical protein
MCAVLRKRKFQSITGSARHLDARQDFDQFK